jgi:plasmid stabilization system protein ParE
VKVRFTPSAEAEYVEALTFVLKDNRRAALLFGRKIESALRRVARYPDSGRKLPEFPELPHREIIVPPYRLFYRVEHRTIWIVALWHGARVPRPPKT